MSSYIPQDAPIFVAGHRGLAGSAIVRKLRSLGYQNLLLRTHAELDLEDSGAVAVFSTTSVPEFVFLAAAKVGGILANRDFPAEFIARNLRIQIQCDRKRPPRPGQPIALSRLQLHLSQAGSATHLGRSTARRAAGVHQPLLCRGQDCRHRDVLGLQPPVWNAAIWPPCPPISTAWETTTIWPTPTFCPRSSAKCMKPSSAATRTLTVWGTGKPLREFLFSDDMADACVFLLNLSEG